MEPNRPKTPAERVGEQVADLERQSRRITKSQFDLPPASPDDLSQQIIERQAGQAREGRSRGK